MPSKQLDLNDYPIDQETGQQQMNIITMGTYYFDKKSKHLSIFDCNYRKYGYQIGWHEEVGPRLRFLRGLMGGRENVEMYFDVSKSKMVEMMKTMREIKTNDESFDAEEHKQFKEIITVITKQLIPKSHIYLWMLYKLNQSNQEKQPSKPNPENQEANTDTVEKLKLPAIYSAAKLIL